MPFVDAFGGVKHIELPVAVKIRARGCEVVFVKSALIFYGHFS